MRRNFISVTNIRRIQSAYRKKSRDEYNSRLISYNDSLEKETQPIYELTYFNFNQDTRLTKIEFTQTQHYRTIEKYITQNYVKYPIYSDWKIKTKKISKSLKLTNSALEELNCHSDPLIKEFAFDIVISLNTDDLLPSWFIREYAKKESKEKTQKLRQELNQFTYEQEQEIRKIQKNISTATIAINEKAEIIKAIQTKKLKLEQKLNNINSAKKSIFLNIITFGIYYYYTSKTRKDKLEKKISVYQIDIDSLEESVDKCKQDIFKYKEIIETINRKISQREKFIYTQIDQEFSNLKEVIANIEPLKSIISHNDDNFTLLKSFVGFDYEKVIGCYIIHNRQNDKYYVGQSKDVMKRIKQHFKGTTPHNIIFAEDYYSTPVEDRENLFEIKIIPCSNKDELDKTEKELIIIYDAFHSGYNGTEGNS